MTPGVREKEGGREREGRREREKGGEEKGERGRERGGEEGKTSPGCDPPPQCNCTKPSHRKSAKMKKAQDMDCMVALVMLNNECLDSQQKTGVNQLTVH